MPGSGTARRLDADSFAESVLERLPPSPADKNPLPKRGRYKISGTAPAGTFLLRRAIRRTWEDVVGEGAVLVLQGFDAGTMETVRAVLERLPDALRLRGRDLEEQRIEKLILDLVEDPKPPSGLELDNALARIDFMNTHPCLSAPEVQQISGHRSANRSMPASRWKADGKIFSVGYGGRDYYPAFQFRDGQPHPAVAKVLAALPDDMTDWQKAFWFTSGNGWLTDGARPIDRLDEEADLTAAAAILREPNIG